MWKDPKKVEEASKALSMQSENLLEFRMIDCIIEEGEGGFHLNIEEVLSKLQKKILQYINELSNLSLEELVEKRRKKYRSF